MSEKPPQGAPSSSGPPQENLSPQALPAEWLQQITEVVKASVPAFDAQKKVSAPTPLPHELPEIWLSQIKRAVISDRPTLLPVLLGSSLLAALIGASASLITAYVTIRASGDLELRKLQWTDQQAERKATFASYASLDSKLSDLSQKLAGVDTLINIAREGHDLQKPGVSANLRAQLQQVGISEGTIVDLKTDPRIDSETWDKVDRLLNAVATAIGNPDPNFAALSRDASAIEADSRDAISLVRQKEDQIRDKSVGTDRR